MAGFGIQETLNVTIEQIKEIGNVTSPEQFFIKVNAIIYSGWLYFILAWVVVFILYVIGQQNRDEPINNAFVSFLITSVLVLIQRAIYGIVYGIEQALISDLQLWVFPVITAFLGWYLWSSNKDG